MPDAAYRSTLSCQAQPDLLVLSAYRSTLSCQAQPDLLVLSVINVTRDLDAMLTRRMSMLMLRVGTRILSTPPNLV